MVERTINIVIEAKLIENEDEVIIELPKGLLIDKGYMVNVQW